ncbi:unnamed protein product, partial [Durusdinium trenchii]
VQPISSLGWCSILKAASSKSTATFEDALAAYNSHPEVVAHDRQETGSGTISLDSRKKQAVRHWVDKTSQEAYEEVVASTHDQPFGLGPFGEGFAATSICFLQSKTNLEANPLSDETDHPMSGEAFCEVDWSLPMTPLGQLIFFQRVKSLFSRATVGIPLHAKKKYRLSPEELAKERNASVFFAQVWPHLKVRIPEADWPTWESDFIQGKSHDFAPFLESRPSKLSLSMLKSQKAAAEQLQREKDNLIFSQVSQQRQEVLGAQFTFFKVALNSDQAKLARVAAVPAKVKGRLHEKMVQARKSQADAGRRACQGYQDLMPKQHNSQESFVRVTQIPKIELMQSEIAKMKSHIVSQAGCQALCKGMAMINESHPLLAASIVIQPITPKIQASGAEMRSNARRFGCGRIVVSSSATAGAATNQWLNGELAIYGRSIGPNEGMDGAPDAVRISERLRPSLEQVAAQKGAKRLEMLLSSALRGCKFRAVCVVNMTGYVEELAQVINLRIKGQIGGEGGDFNTKFLYYLSCHVLDGPEHFKYGKARVNRELMDLWIDRKITFGGIRFEDEEPKLSAEVLCAGPERNRVQNPPGPGEGHLLTFKQLQQQHDEKYKNILDSVLTTGYVPAADDGDSAAAATHVQLEWHAGDKTPIQVDMSSLNADSQAGFPCMTLYKYLVSLERSKRVTKYDLSYSECQRKTGGSDDGFEIKIKEGAAHVYQTMTNTDSAKPPTCKNIFHDCAQVIRGSASLLVVFRYRYERVHAVSKVKLCCIMADWKLSVRQEMTRGLMDVNAVPFTPDRQFATSSPSGPPTSGHPQIQAGDQAQKQLLFDRMFDQTSSVEGGKQGQSCQPEVCPEVRPDQKDRKVEHEKKPRETESQEIESEKKHGEEDSRKVEDEKSRGNPPETMLQKRAKLRLAAANAGLLSPSLEVFEESEPEAPLPTAGPCKRPATKQKLCKKPSIAQGGTSGTPGEEQPGEEQAGDEDPSETLAKRAKVMRRPAAKKGQPASAKQGASLEALQNLDWQELDGGGKACLTGEWEIKEFEREWKPERGSLALVQAYPHTRGLQVFADSCSSWLHLLTLCEALWKQCQKV